MSPADLRDLRLLWRFGLLLGALVGLVIAAAWHGSLIDAS